jgi:hypothetical protein
MHAENKAKGAGQCVTVGELACRCKLAHRFDQSLGETVIERVA